MIDILDNARVNGEEPKLIVRKASHAQIWSAPHPRKSSRGLLRKVRQAGSKPADDPGLRNAGENAMPSALIREVNEGPMTRVSQPTSAIGP
jgi:hypothetical protein